MVWRTRSTYNINGRSICTCIALPIVSCDSLLPKGCALQPFADFEQGIDCFCGLVARIEVTLQFRVRNSQHMTAQGGAHQALQCIDTAWTRRHFISATATTQHQTQHQQLRSISTQHQPQHRISSGILSQHQPQYSISSQHQHQHSTKPGNCQCGCSRACLYCPVLEYSCTQYKEQQSHRCEKFAHTRQSMHAPSISSAFTQPLSR